MRVTIEGVKMAPSWRKLELMLQTALDDDSGLFTRIRRPDGRSDYRGLGKYEVTWLTRSTGREETLILEVKA